MEGYEKIYNKFDENRIDILYLVALHSMKSRKFKNNLIYQHQNTKTQLINQMSAVTLHDNYKDFGYAALFAVLNHEKKIFPPHGSQIGKDEDQAMKVLKKGFKGKLYRADGSSKQAIIDMNEENIIKAYKYPDGEIKKKYTMSIRQIRDWQFIFNANDDAWRNSVFAKSKGGLFDGEAQPKNCIVLLGSRQWGDFSFICM